jgi:hypothetical protein
VLEDGIEIFTSLNNPDLRKIISREVTDQFGSDSAVAIERVLVGLKSILFVRPALVYRQGDQAQHWLIDYVETAKLDEFAGLLGAYFMSLREAANVAVVKETALIDFLRNWIHSVAVDLTPPYPAFQSPTFQFPEASWQNQEPTSSETAAFNRWLQDISALETQLNTALELETAKRLVGRIGTLLETARKGVGASGAEALGAHYREIAWRQSAAALFWTAVAVASVITVIVMAAKLIDTGISTTNWINTVVHLAIVLPLIGLASYAARIARHHRLLTRWAITASVQLNTIATFAELLPSDTARESLIMNLGSNVFSAPSWGEDTKVEHISWVPPELLDLLKDIAAKLPVPK